MGKSERPSDLWLHVGSEVRGSESCCPCLRWADEVEGDQQDITPDVYKETSKPRVSPEPPPRPSHLPPRQIGERILPCLARPLPFCGQGFRPPPRTSALVLVLA